MEQQNPKLNSISLVTTLGSCKGQTKQGLPCKIAVAPGSEFCLAHDPQRQEEYKKTQQERGRKGVIARRARLAKKRSSSPVPLASTDEIRNALEKALGAVNGAKEANALEKAEKVARICSVALSAIKTIELEREVRELQEQVEGLLATKNKRPATNATIDGVTRYPSEGNQPNV